MSLLRRMLCRLIGHKPHNADYSRRRYDTDYFHPYICGRCKIKLGASMNPRRTK